MLHPEPNPWRMIACDLDGTLIGRDGRPNQRDLAALHRARASGMYVTICTGRNFTESRRVMDALGLEGPGVFTNGATICSMPTGRSLKRHVIDETLLDLSLDVFGGMGLAMLLLSEDPITGLPHYYVTDHGPTHAGTTAWLEHNGMHAEQWPGGPAGQRPQVLRIGVVVDSPSEPALTATVAERFGARVAHHGLHSPSYDCHVVELFGPEVSKWSGLEEVARLQGIDPRRVIAIGDDSNDISMLQGAELSFAMSTAHPHVARHAKRMTASQAESGVAQVVEGIFNGRW